MKILVTGGGGFVGSNFIRLALQQGHEVVSTSVDDSAPKTSRLTNLNKRIGQIESQDLDGCDAIAHFAAYGVTPKPCDLSAAYEINVLQSIKLLEMTRKCGIKRFVTSGSYAEYGLSGLRYEKIPSDAPLEPTDTYAASKAAACIALTSYARSNKMQIVYGRIFSAYGEGQHMANFWPSLRKAALAGDDFEMTSGEQIRDFLPVHEVARKFLAACTTDGVEDGVPVVENVASGTPVTLADFARTWWEEFGANGKLKIGAIPYREHEVMRYVPDLSNQKVLI
jgi:nucleoside-diphosphate-sugar epimerase